MCSFSMCIYSTYYTYLFSMYNYSTYILTCVYLVCALIPAIYSFLFTQYVHLFQLYNPFVLLSMCIYPLLYTHMYSMCLPVFFSTLCKYLLVSQYHTPQSPSMPSCNVFSHNFP